MIEVWYIDKNGFWTGERDTVFVLEEGMTDVKMLTGYVKARLVNNEWVEGATEEEIREWEEANKIDICPEPTTEEKLVIAEEKIAKLEEQIKATNEQQDFYENCIVEMAEVVYA